MTRFTLVLVAASLWLGTAGCGVPLADGDYPGEPLITLHGTIRDTSPIPDDEDSTLPVPSGPLRLGVIWSQAGLTGLAGLNGLVSVADQQGVARGIFPAEFTLAFHHPPPDKVLSDASGGGQIAIGLLIAYVDVDSDGGWNANVDRLVGGALHPHGTDELEGSALVYSPDGASDGEMTFAPGFSHITLEAKIDPETGGCPGGQPAWKLEPVEAPLLMAIDVTRPSAALFDLDCDGDLSEWGHACPEGPISTLCPGWTCESPGAGTCAYTFCCTEDDD